MKKDDSLVFVDEVKPTEDLLDPFKDCWHLLVVDDDPEVHAITRLVLSEVTLLGKELKLHSANSSQEAKQLLLNDTPFAIALIDVVMETDQAGLELINWIRKVKQNLNIRLVLRTGQPGKAPEREVITNYDINDYRSKTDLTSMQLYTLTCACLRSYRDITAKKVAENENMLKSTFLANISHELRTPMHSILSFSELSIPLLSKMPASRDVDKLTRYSNNINSSGKRLLILINNLLDIEKLGTGCTSFIPVFSDFIDIINDTLAEMEGFLFDRLIQVNIENKSSDTRVWIDTTLMLQVMINLLSNAVKFSPKNSVITIDITDIFKKIDSDVNKVPQPALEVKVLDQGIGIPEEELLTIFEPFVQSTATKKAMEGSGLGLPICQKILSFHQGQIEAINLPDKGACFSFQLLKTENIE